MLMRYRFRSEPFAFNRWYRRFAWFPQWIGNDSGDAVIWLETYYECTQSNGIRLIRTPEEMRQEESAS
jgi:hypothetical protein